ncbi:FYDLN acid domain-containing protein [Sphingomonas sp. S1-29]|uniref:FYDLN acid domain-containing protein n=1 Tax=Sphingomonas qomolangmaensis TaxID=2918765 RepID=A0ABY5LAR1_9SPHN|nr:MULTISPECIES: FYDLN acid domain-containing protein [Sphingomonas]UUL83847.1 FYDLN acid domain-containing protein [Sphingomonas qomolangmaensis]UZK70360.1 FYDLN acid domain-containing protein [Sphingomonas sp. S1-29]
MIKPEWGTKRACPKCGTRFYDLGKEDPVSCIACGVTWNPEPILKSKQPLPFEAAKAAPVKEKAEDSDLGDDIDVEDDDTPADDDVDLGGDEDLGVETPADEHET